MAFPSIPDGLPQGRARPGKEAIHPAAFTPRIVVLANRFSRPERNRRHCRATFGDIHIASLIASLQLAIQPQFHTQSLMAHAGLYLLACDLIATTRK